MCIGTKLSTTKYHRLSTSNPAVFVEKTSVFKIPDKRPSSLDTSNDNSSQTSNTSEEKSDGSSVTQFPSDRRGGVSSGSLEVIENKRKSEKIPKDQRSRDSISRIFNNNLFFSHLDSEERTEITDALVQETAEPGDLIIRSVGKLIIFI